MDDIYEQNIDAEVDREADIREELESSPQHKTASDLFSLFWKVIKIKDSSKVGFLKKEELGHFNISVRDLQRIELIADTLGHPHFGNFFGAQGEITLATSSSRDGWLVDKFITSKAERTKHHGGGGATDNLLNQPSQPKKKKFFFF